MRKSFFTKETSRSLRKCQDKFRTSTLRASPRVLLVESTMPLEYSGFAHRNPVSEWYRNNGHRNRACCETHRLSLGGANPSHLTTSGRLRYFSGTSHLPSRPFRPILDSLFRPFLDPFRQTFIALTCLLLRSSQRAEISSLNLRLSFDTAGLVFYLAQLYWHCSMHSSHLLFVTVQAIVGN